MKHIKLFESFKLNESFWVNLQPGYKQKDVNGNTFLNVSGVPGGYEGRGEDFIDYVTVELEKSKNVITPNVIKVAMKAFGRIDDLIELRKDLKKPADWWAHQLHGTKDQNWWDKYADNEKFDFSLDDKYRYAGAAYLIWWLIKHEGKKISKMSY